MTTSKPAAPREPHNIPIRIYATAHPTAFESRLAELEKKVRGLERAFNEALLSGRLAAPERLGSRHRKKRGNRSRKP